MSVLKLSKNDIIRKEDKEEKIKLKRSDLSLDSARISGWEQANRQSLDILNDYNNRINKSEWLDKEDRAKYRQALDSYIETANLLRGINKTFGEGYSDDDEQKWADSIASMNKAYDSTEKYYSQWIDEKDYKGQRDGWFQSGNLFDDGYQFGDVIGTIAASATDVAENIGAGIIGMGEAALDALFTLSPYFAQSQYYQNGGGYNPQLDAMFDQSIEASKEWSSDFVKKDLYDEQEVADLIVSGLLPVEAFTGINPETDSVFGEKTDGLVQSAGQLAATAGLQAVGVPWWLTTGATALGSESESALNQGATLDQAALSGVISAGAEILTEKLAGGISFGGKTLEDFLPKITANISNKVVRKLVDLGIDMVGEGAEEVLSGVMSAIGQKMTYASDKEISELFSSEELRDSFIGGAVLGFGGSVIGKPIAANKQAREIYGSGADLVTEALDIDSNNAYAQKMQAKLDKGKSLSGGQINRIVEANENALVSQDKGKMKTAVESRLTELGERGNISTLADIIVKAQSGGKLTSSERSILANSKYGRRVSTELNPKSIESGEYTSRWAENIGTERINAEAYSRGVTTESKAVQELKDMDVVTENAPVNENAVEGEISAPVGDAKNATTTVAKATMVDNEGNNVEAKVAKIAEVEGGVATLELEGGQTVKASDVDFGDSGIGLVYQAATEMVSGVGGFNVDAANLMVRGVNPKISEAAASLYVAGFNEAYRYGAMGYPVSALATGNATSKLGVAQREAAYNLGKAYGEGKVALKQAKIDSTVSIKAGKDSQKATKKGKVYFDGSTVGKSLTERQRASLKGLRVVAEAMGVDIHIIESKVVDGKRVGKNGSYDPDKKIIEIDLYAGNDGNGLMLFTASHELTHHIRKVAPAKFKVFADALLEEYAKNGESIDKLIVKKIEHLEANKRLEGMTEEQAYDLAYEEVVADAAESMLVDSNAIEALSKKLQVKDKSLWETIKDFIAKLVDRIKAAYKGLDPDSHEGKLLREMEYSAERLQKLWVDALLEASDMVSFDGKTESVSPMLSERTWTASEYVTEREETAKKISKALGVSLQTAYKYIDDINGVARLIADDRARLDYEPNLDEKATVLKPNSEYKFSVDMSTLCAKRLLFTGTFDAIQRALPNTVFDSEDIVSLREMMQERGYEVACGICYVESTRREIGRITQDFINGYKEAQKTGKPITRINSKGKAVDLKKTKDQMETTADKSTDKFFAEKGYTPTLADLNTTDIDLVKRDYPLVYEAYLNFMNARGQAKPKLLETRAEYKGEILKHFKAKTAVKARNDAGGLRLQSFSDFEVPHMIDMMQIVMDMSRVGLKSQAYTKVPAFAEVFGDTGVKINLSLIAKGDGLDSKGNLIFDDVEGINHKEAFALRDKYSKNVGTILVGKTDAHIIAAMADPHIDFIIPFHKSSWKESLYDALGLTGYADYTDTQNEKPLDKGRKIKNFDPSEYWDFTKSGDENAQIYLEKCREDGRIPKFPQFQGYPGYWKLLIDFKMYDNDGVGSPQEVVKPVFNTEASDRILREYEGGHKSFPIAKDVVADFVKEHKDKVKYSDRDSHGNELSKKQKEFFKDSKARDEEGNLLVLYHGTSTEQRITEFKTTEGWRTGLWLSTDHETAVHFARLTEYLENDPSDDTRLFTKENSSDGIGRQGVYELYANVKNPLIVDAQGKRYWEIPRPSAMGKGDAVSGEEINAFALENNYDGVIIENVVEGSNRLGTDVIVFSPNQAKYTDNLNPTEGNDIRYSDRDSEGNQLSKEQQKFFKDSKVRWGDKLMPVYHGTRREFTVFDASKGYDENRNGGLLWAAKDYEYAKDYSYLDEPIVMKGYLNITNLLDIGDIDTYSDYGTRLQELADLVKLTPSELEAMVDYKRILIYDITSSKSFRDRIVELGYDGVTAQESGLQTFGFVDSNQFKDTTNKTPTSDPDVRYSDRKNIGYHAGDLGKAEWLHQQGYYRGTGHFGTGTYFVGDEAKISGDSTYGKRPHHAVDFSDYNLYKAKNDRDGYDLHEQLRVIDGGISQEWLDAAENDQFSLVSMVDVYDLAEERFGEDKYSQEAMESAIHELAEKHGLELLSREEYSKQNDIPLDDEDFLFYYVDDYLKRAFKDEAGKLDSAYGEFRDAHFRLKLRFGYGATKQALQKVISYQNANSDTRWHTDKKDSLATVFMKALGYEGIDVRGTGLDNTAFGSVIYDLKEETILYSDRVTDKKTLDFLEKQEHVTVYRAMQVIDGELYPPMNAYTKDETGKKVLMTPSAMGEWEQAVERPDLIDPKTGKFKLDKGKVDGGKRGTIIPAAYNPYFHTSASPLNDQFSSAYKRSNLVVVEGKIPASELTIGYRAEFAKDTVGETKWHSGPVAGKLKGDKARRVFLSRWFKPVRIVPDSEVASIVAKTLEGENIEVPYNVVTPSLRTELEKVGVPIIAQDRGTDSYSNRSLLAGALETAVQNDIEREKLRQYKQKIDLINSEEKKLYELREQIKELSFKKGPRDTEAIRSLQFEANQAANRINTYDKQLLNLESTKALKGVLEREKALARKRDAQKYKEALERYREKSAKTQRELMDRYQESRKRGVENRNKTAMRHKIKDVVNDLNNYLLKGTKDKHVPIELQKAVAEALDAVNMDTVGAEERISKLKAEMMRAKTPEAAQEIAKTIERIEEMGGNMAKKISRLKTAYDSIINSDDPLIANSHDEVISNTIERVMNYVGETPLRDMSLSQLEVVHDMYKMVLHSIRAANKAFKANKSEEISVIANRIMEEIDKLGKKKALQSKAGQTLSEFDWNNQKPVYAFERIGSDTFTEVYNNVRAGEDIWATDMTEAQEYREAQYKKHKYDSWDFTKRFGFTSTSGMHFELTLDQIMSLYAYSKREQAAEHLKRGGIVFDESTEVTAKNKLGIPTKFNPTEATAYNISEETLADIISKLTPEQKAFVDEMQDYLSTVMGEKGNEVSLELYGVKLFKEKHYFPLKSATQFMAKAKEQQKGEVKIKNSGFTKETVRKANNPIVLTPFMDVWAGHVNEMSMYHAFTLALEDFYRVYNYKTPTSETMATESVEMFLQNAHGKAATKYIDQLLKDLNGGARVDSTVGIINKLTGLFKKSAVFASASVVVQQPSAIARATALVDTKYFVGKPSKHKETWAEVKRYAPVAVIKEMGYFDTGMGKSSVEWLKGEKTWKDKVDDFASKAPALADEYAWCAIWNAVKRETVHNNPSLKTSSDEFLKLVGERFTEVIVKTQVYDSVLARSANMRSKDTGMKMATAFMGEPTTSLNMLQDALIQGKRGNKKYAAKAIGGVVSSMILNSILVSIVYAGRDDDEDKTYAEKYISTLTEELLDSFNPLTLVPFIKDIVSIAQGYDIERSDMAVITDLINAWNNLDSDNRSVYRKVEDFGGAIAAIFGLPVKNVMRDVRGMYNTIISFINGEKTTVAGIVSAIEEVVTGKEKSNGQQLYEAIIKGDAAQIERIKGRFEGQKAIDAALRKALRENDPRIKEAAEAVIGGKGADYARLVTEIVDEGKFSRKIITGAISAEADKIRNSNK